MKFSPFFLIFILLSFYQSSFAEIPDYPTKDGYFSINVGVANQNDLIYENQNNESAKFEFERGNLISLAVGKFSDDKQWRIEGELFRIKTGIKKHTAVSGDQLNSWDKSTGFALNVYRDFNNSTRFTPYAGIGIGFLDNNGSYDSANYVTSNQDTSTSMEFFKQIKLGVSNPIGRGDNIWFVEYRYLKTNDSIIDAGSRLGRIDSFGSELNIISAGIRIGFDW